MQTDRQDKSALGWDHQEKLQLHESQKGTGSHLGSVGFRRRASCLSRTPPDMHVTASQEIDTVSLEFKYAADTDRIMMPKLMVSVLSGVLLKNVF